MEMGDGFLFFSEKEFADTSFLEEVLYREAKWGVMARVRMEKEGAREGDSWGGVGGWHVPLSWWRLTELTSGLSGDQAGCARNLECSIR